LKIVDIPLEWLYTQGEGVRVGIVDTHCDIDHPLLKDRIETYTRAIHDRDYGKEHCTHIAGLIASIAPKCRIDIAQALFMGDGSSDSVAKSIVCLTNEGVDVINLSLALSEDFPCVRDAIKDALSKNIIVVGAVSNDGLTDYPAAYTGVLSVSAYGEGEADIYTEEKLWSSMPGGGYAYQRGHSMSTGCCSGVVALARSFDKTMNRDKFIVRLLK
jgi:major intracellular serine protease